MYYHSNNGSYAGVCGIDAVVKTIDALKAIDPSVKVGCWVAQTPKIGASTNGGQDQAINAKLDRIDWALTVYYSHNNYSVNPQGVVKFDTDNITSANNVGWDGAVTLCANVGKHLPSVSQLRALRMAHGDAAPSENNHYQGKVGGGSSGINQGFTSSTYWSATEHDADYAWLVYISSGHVTTIDKQNGQYVRCVS